MKIIKAQKHNDTGKITVSELETNNNIIHPDFSKNEIESKATEILKSIASKSNLDFYEYFFSGNNENSLKLEKINLTNGKKDYDRVVEPLANELFYGLFDWALKKYEELNPNFSECFDNKLIVYDFIYRVFTTGEIFSLDEYVNILFTALQSTNNN